jgi:hypothetical protein
MAIVTRVNGDAEGVVNFDSATDGTLGTIISTGLTRSPLALRVALGNSQEFTAAESGVGGAVETILRQIAIDGTVVMYQVDTTALSVLLESTNTNAAGIQTRLQALAANIGAAANVYAGAGVTVSSAVGFKLAAS